MTEELLFSALTVSCAIRPTTPDLYLNHRPYDSTLYDYAASGINHLAHVLKEQLFLCQGE